MDEEKYSKNIKWLLYGSFILDAGFLLVGLLQFFLNKDIYAFAREALLGLSSYLILYGQYMKADFDYRKQKEPFTQEEHDQGL